jgi:CheY-like chemotaxis protein
MTKNDGGPATILVAEDDEDNRLVMKMLLELRGYRVVTAANGLEALELAARERPDLILMDLRMPQLNGLATARQLRQHVLPELQHVPIVALSAYDPSQHRNVALSAGCNEYVTKPINYELLEKLIKDLLRARNRDSGQLPQTALPDSLSV